MEVTAYLRTRLAGGAGRRVPLQHLARLIHQHTDGNPLFMVSVVNDLMERGALVEHAGQWDLRVAPEALAVLTPANIRHMIEQQLERLSPEDQRMLEAASVAGVEFSAATVATGTGRRPKTVEEQCARLSRRGQWLKSQGAIEWPDGTIAAGYRFLHAVYQEVLYERVSPGVRRNCTSASVNDSKRRTRHTSTTLSLNSPSTSNADGTRPKRCSILSTPGKSPSVGQPPRSGAAFHQSHRAAHHLAGLAGTSAARTVLAAHARSGVDGHPRAGRTGSRVCLRTGVGPVSAARRGLTDLCCRDGALHVPHRARRCAERTRVCGTMLAFGRAGPRSSSFTPGPQESRQ